MSYCEAIYETRRWKTREVRVGHLGIGGDNPIRLQSMTTSDTRDVAATVDQVMRLADAGCEIVRVTVQGKKEAEACEAIKNTLLQKGYETPLVADIHFYPPAALLVADFVEKIRVNPGNYADKRATFRQVDHDAQSYAVELERIEQKLAPLLEKCKRLDRALRIGTNHGSLSDRIMTRFGDSPLGMVESALEFADICRKHDFHNFVFSMKASNPIVMIQAYRLLVSRMMEMRWNYPLHLGVTEAGEGEDGRVKSAVGIGSLLLDGLGDTIRVSLTEDPWLEMDPCQRLRDLAAAYVGRGRAPFEEIHRPFENIQVRSTRLPPKLPLHPQGSVFVYLRERDLADPKFPEQLGLGGDRAVDGVIVEDSPSEPSHRAKLQQLAQQGVSILSPARLPHGVRLLSLEQAESEQRIQARVQRFTVSLSDPTEGEPLAVWIRDEEPKEWRRLLSLKPDLIFLRPVGSPVHHARGFFEFLKREKLDIPVILAFGYVSPVEDLLIQASAEMGSLLCDGLGEGVAVDSCAPTRVNRELGFNILQASRRRTSKTEFISCPSCGRTLFDLQEVTQKIKARTGHLKGVKIAVMGCIVNGPGEMADADFGYVGSKAGKIDLYVGRECVERNIDFDQAEDRLVALIKAHGRWTEAEGLVQRVES